MAEAIFMETCKQCNDNQIQEPGQICPQCMIDNDRGYRVRSLAGRCANGSELDHGTRFHALPLAYFSEWGDDTSRALCGAKPGRRSVGWTIPSYGGSQKSPTCPRCVKKLEKANEWPRPGDYVRLKDNAGNLTENCTTVYLLRMILHRGRYSVIDQTGETYMIARYPEADNDVRRAWQEILYLELKEGEKP